MREWKFSKDEFSQRVIINRKTLIMVNWVGLLEKLMKLFWPEREVGNKEFKEEEKKKEKKR